ncbi:unnamed protein product [Lymnaea stagnalis]|uniref:NADH-cytochrome b5 reductase n=1 Tax=Lymnaea stagnalis TaxID=6523 RepID=A0AAV2I5L5_LYMST
MLCAEKLDSSNLPEPPERPLPKDCCGSGCVPCVFDIYEQELAMWEAECKSLNAYERNDDIAVQACNKGVGLKPDKYCDFTILSVLQETPDILRFRCSVPNNTSLGLLMGQHIIARSKARNGSMIVRRYTPISPLSAKGYFDLLIKIYPEGCMSQFVQTWKVGDKISARGPAGHFEYTRNKVGGCINFYNLKIAPDIITVGPAVHLECTRNKYHRVLMLSAGTGVAPMCQVINTVLDDEKDETFLRLVYACRSYKDLMAKKEIDEWTRYWNFSVIFVLSQEIEEENQSYRYREEILRGHINKELLGKEIRNDLSKLLVLVCGSKTFNADMITYIKDLGVPDENIHRF